MPCNDYDNNSRNYEEIQLGDDKLNTVTTFKYLGINIRFKWRSREGHRMDEMEAADGRAMPQTGTNQAERQGV